MISDLTETGNVALQGLLRDATKMGPLNRFDHGYLRGQLTIIRIYLEPDRGLYAAAADAIERLPRATD